MASPIARVESRKPYREHSLEEVAEALTKSKGMVSVAARMLDLSQQAVRQRIAKYTTLQQVVKDAREATTDVAELRLYDRINAGEGWAICFYLKTQAKDRGYIERTEIANPVGETFKVEPIARDYREGLTPFLPPPDELDG